MLLNSAFVRSVSLPEERGIECITTHLFQNLLKCCPGAETLKTGLYDRGLCIALGSMQRVSSLFHCRVGGLQVRRIERMNQKRIYGGVLRVACLTRLVLKIRCCKPEKQGLCYEGVT
jgi:hypothetical protein